MPKRALGGLGDAYYQRGHMRTVAENFGRCVALCRENGFGEIEAANLNMLANSRAYLLQAMEAARDFEEYVELTERLGLRRPLVISLMGGDVKLDLDDLTGALASFDKGLAVIERIGARRFEPWCLAFKGKVLARQGQKAEALKLAGRGIATCRETGFTFLGPLSLGNFALLCDDAEKRQAVFDEAEAVLAGGCVSHNHFWSYRDAMRFADALEKFTSAEPLQWSDYYIAWARALADWGRGERSGETELRRLLALAQDAHLDMAVPALERALEQV